MINSEYRPGKPIKSVISTHVAKVKFINKSNRPVDIIWINFSSKLIRYKHLEPHQFIDINTFTNHPWIAVDTITRDNLHLNHKEIFVVESFKCDVKLGNIQRTVTQADVRVPVFITLPLDSLKKCAVKLVRDLIKTVENIKFLELPDVLRCDLEKSFEYKFKNCNITDR